MKLYVEIKDTQENKSERVVLCEFFDDSGDKCFMKPTVWHGEFMMEVLVDEGYARVYYYYPVPRYVIESVYIYE